ncbi:hypothetical protein COOONC_19411 [Cooperia oncophora]
MFSTPSGTICEGWKETDIPRNVSDPFNAFIEVVDGNKKKYEAAEVYYSAKDEIVIVNGAKKDGFMPFINETNVPDGVVSVVHDFARGYEYSLHSTPCLRPLPNDSADVTSSEGMLSMRPLADILVAPDLKFGNYGQVTTDDGRTLSVYRAFDNKTGEVVEVHFDGNWLEKYLTFKVGLMIFSRSFLQHGNHITRTEVWLHFNAIVGALRKILCSSMFQL